MRLEINIKNTDIPFSSEKSEQIKGILLSVLESKDETLAYNPNDDIRLIEKFEDIESIVLTFDK